MRERRKYSRYLPIRRREHALTVLNRITADRYLEVSVMAMICFVKTRFEALFHTIRRPFENLSRRLILILWILFSCKAIEMTSIDSL